MNLILLQMRFHSHAFNAHYCMLAQRRLQGKSFSDIFTIIKTHSSVLCSKPRCVQTTGIITQKIHSGKHAPR